MIRFKKIFINNPLFYDAPFCSFFFLGGLYSLLNGIWLSLHGADLLNNRFAIDTINFYQHEMIFAIFVPILAGFLLTVIPYWTKTEKLQSQSLAKLIYSWLVARILTGGIHLWGVIPGSGANAVFLLLVIWYLIKPLADKKQGYLRLYGYQFIGFFVVQVLASIAWFEDQEQLFHQYLQVGIGFCVIMVLMVFGRISTNVLKQALSQYPTVSAQYHPYPARRNFAILLIYIYLPVNFYSPECAYSGWLSLACAAALLNILNDWHLPKAWRDSYVFAMYSVYLLMALGFALSGINRVWGARVDISLIDLQFSSWINLVVILILLITGQRLTSHRLQLTPLIRWIICLMFMAVCSFLLSNVMAELRMILMLLGLVFCSSSLLLWLIYFTPQLQFKG